MRFVPIQCLRVGMKVGKSLYSKDNNLILTESYLLTELDINNIKKLQYSGIYIDYNISEDLEVSNDIKRNLEDRVDIAIKNIYIPDNVVENKALNYREIAKVIINDILNNEDIMINLIELKLFDGYTYYHSVNVFIMSMLIGISLKFSEETLRNLCLSALLHDIGKVFIDKNILNKQGKLTEEEYEIVKRHSVCGYNKVKLIPCLNEDIAIGILDHHEKCDGTGYPNGKSANDICLYGRIISVIDVYEALTSDRPYKKGDLPSLTIQYMQESCAQRFDKKILDIFIKTITPYPVGTYVKLSNGLCGTVTKNYMDAMFRPLVTIYKQGNENIGDSFEINLKEDKDYSSIKVVKILH